MFDSSADDDCTSANESEDEDTTDVALFAFFKADVETGVVDPSRTEEVNDKVEVHDCKEEEEEGETADSATCAVDDAELERG